VFTSHQVNLATESLKVGTNTVEMLYWNKYRNDSVGLHSFIDGVDNEQYLYTQFEPSHAHYVFPCFDQPSIKAKWTFRSAVCEGWTCVSNEPVNTEKDSQECKDTLRDEFNDISIAFE
jgi:aminopeptidase N